MQNSGKLKVAREICIPSFTVPNGHYVIIPSTKDVTSSGEYFIKVYFDTENDEHVSISKLGDTNVIL